MKRYLDPTKLLQERKITQAEFERIKSLSSKWDNPFISSIVPAFGVIIGTLMMSAPLALFAPIIIVVGCIIMGFGIREKKY